MMILYLMGSSSEFAQHIVNIFTFFRSVVAKQLYIMYQSSLSYKIFITKE